MYQIVKTKGNYRENPWDISISDRIEKIKEAKEIGKKVVAFLYPKFDGSTFRYRGYNVVETLEYSFHWAGACFQYADRPDILNLLPGVDVLVLIRCHWDEKMDELLDAAKANGITLCYDIDDLVYSPQYMENLIQTLDLKEDFEVNFWFGQTYRNKLIADRCDCFITTNDYLADHIRNDFHKPCHVLQNYLNWYQEEVSKEYFEQKLAMEPSDDFEIGYFSGSPTHVKDIMIALPELERFLQEHKDAILKIVGYMDFPPKWEHLVREGRVRFVPFQSFVGLQYEQAMVDVNIVPLTCSDFSNCKSELKYFENAIVGTITIASPTYTYKNAIESGRNGYLCREGEWYDALSEVYQKRHDRSNMNVIRDHALGRYSNRKQLQKVEAILREISSYAGDKNGSEFQQV